MEFNRKLKKLFNKTPSSYHSSRKGYPAQIYDDIIKISNISKKSTILDIGCGSGLSTLPFAEKGYVIVGIDISPNLIEIAKKESKNGNPSYIIDSFEKHDFNGQKFDLVTSGQAFHWLDEKIAYKKTAEILKEGGYLAIFAKFNDYKRSDFLKKLREIFIEKCRYYPDGLHQGDYANDYEKEINNTNLFKNVEKKTYGYTINYTLKDYRNYILSNSWMIKLNKNESKDVMAKIDSLMKNYVWPMDVPFGASLITAKLR